jgi:hypothetical protein
MPSPLLHGHAGGFFIQVSEKRRGYPISTAFLRYGTEADEEASGAVYTLPEIRRRRLLMKGEIKCPKCV